MTRKETTAARRQRRQATSGDRGPAPASGRAQGSRDRGPAPAAGRAQGSRDHGPAPWRAQGSRKRDLSPASGSDRGPMEKRNPRAKAFLGGVPSGTQLSYVQKVLSGHFQTSCHVEAMRTSTGSGDQSYAVYFHRPKTMRWACHHIKGLPRPWALRQGKQIVISAFCVSIINQSINQSLNQSINQSIIFVCLFVLFVFAINCGCSWQALWPTCPEP